MRVTVVLVVLSKTSEEFARNNFGRVVMRKNSSDFSCYETRWACGLLITLPIRSGRNSINIWLLFPMKILNAFCIDHVLAPLHITTHLHFLPKSHKRVLTQRLSHLRLFVEFYKNPSPAQDLSPPQHRPQSYSIGTEQRASRPLLPERVQNTLPHNPRQRL